MKKNKSTKDGLLTPTEYWEMKLGIKHSTEKARYKKLCGYKLSKDDKSLLDGAYYITFSDWEKYMDEKLSTLNSKELFDYSKCINGRLENENVFNGIFSGFMLPLIISAITPIVGKILTQYLTEKYDNSVLDFF